MALRIAGRSSRLTSSTLTNFSPASPPSGAEAFCCNISLDLVADGGRVALQGGSPFGSDPIELVLGILKRDMRIEPGSRSGDQVAGDILEVGLRMVLPPHIKEDRVNVRAVLERFHHCFGLAVDSCAGEGGRKSAGVLAGKVRRRTRRPDPQPSAGGCAGLSLMNWATKAGCDFAQSSTYAP